jgi:GH15 family glucan-1,4-alpha-glucosidase
MRCWTSPDNGLWELAVPQHFVHSKVLCWVTLDRAIKIARRVNPGFDTGSWHSVSLDIHRDVMENGWSEALGSFTQHYGAENVDAAELLVSIMDFLPADHPRVRSTVDRIAETLTINGLVYRFDPTLTEGVNDLPLGEMEGAFLPCTFWLATAYAKAGRVAQAREILSRVEQMVGTLGLFPEAIDARLNVFLGNTPLLFSHVEYMRAKLETALAQSRHELSQNRSVNDSVCAREKGRSANRN